MNITPEQSDYLYSLIDAIGGKYWVEAVLYQGSLYISAGLDSFLAIVDLSDKFSPDSYFEFQTEEVVRYEPLFGKLMRMSSNVNQLVNSRPLIYEDPELEKDEKFFNLATLRVSDGAGFYYVHTSTCTTFIPVFNGLPKLGKQDKVAMRMFQLDNNQMLVHMQIAKKKFKLSYNMFYKILNVNLPLR